MSADATPVFRFATAEDIPDIFRVRTSVRENHLNIDQLAERGVTPDSMAATLADDACATWISEDHSGICGFAVADGRRGSIFALFVAPEAEGRGIGRSLLGLAEQWLFDRGHRVIWLNTGEEPDQRSHRVYRAAGWSLTGPADHGDVRYEKRR